MIRISEGVPGLSCHFLSVFIGNCRDLTRFVNRLPVRNQMMSAPRCVIQLLSAEAHAVDLQLNLLCVRADPKIYLLSRVEIPVREYVDHRFVVCRCPCRLPDIKCILCKACRIHLPQIGISRMVRRGLSDVVKARPQELTHRIGKIPVHGDALLQTLGAPARRRIPEGGALLILLRENPCRQREVVDSSAAAEGTGLRPVNHPVRMLCVVRCIIFLGVVVACKLVQIRAPLRVLPGHVIRCGRYPRIAEGIQCLHLFHQHFRKVASLFVRVLVVNLIADAPQDDAGMIAVSSHKAGHVPRLPVPKKARIIIGRLRALPHIEGLIHDQQSHLIGQIQCLCRKRIVGEADGIGAHLLHDAVLPGKCIPVKGRAQCSLVRVQADAVELHVPAVQRKAPVRSKGDLPEADPDPLGLQKAAVPSNETHLQKIEHRIFDVPALDSCGFVEMYRLADRSPAHSLSSRLVCRQCKGSPCRCILLSRRQNFLSLRVQNAYRNPGLRIFRRRIAR